MLALAFGPSSRCIQAIHRQAHSISSLFAQVPFSYCSFLGTEATEKSAKGSLPVKAEAECLSYRIEKLPRGQPVGCAFQSWMGDGFPIHRGEIYHAINRLRKLQMNKRALEVNVFSA